MRNKAIAVGLCVVGLLAGASLTARSDEVIKGFHDGCMKNMVAGMQQKGMTVDNNAQQMVNNYCNCAESRIGTSFTAPELQALQQPNPDPALINRMQPIRQQCFQENFHQ